MLTPHRLKKLADSARVGNELAAAMLQAGVGVPLTSVQDVPPVEQRPQPPPPQGREEAFAGTAVQGVGELPEGQELLRRRQDVQPPAHAGGVTRR